MAKLFKQITLKEKLANYEITDFETKFDIIQKWHDLYHDGTLKKQNETQCEQAFNKDIFQDVLGYKDFTNKEHTLKVQEKVTTSGQKPDATLGYFFDDKEKIKAVCEIKDANTPLDRSQRREGNLSPISQAFKYKHQLKECPFVIATNFYEIRLFKDYHGDYELFTLDSLVDDKNDYFEFRKFHYLLSADNFISKTGQSNTERLLSEIRIEEEEIKKEFYKEYKELRLKLLRDIYKQTDNAKDRFVNFIIPKAQKIIDRVMFIAFAEDRGLLPEHSLRKMIQSQEDSFAPVNLWEYLKGLFNAVNDGLPSKDIPKYNGGLFAPDPELDALKINDDVCREIAEIGKYDFSEEGREENNKGQLDVEILGHIFEQSISDLEDLKTKVNPDEAKQVSKRKKDGIFYTPDYITDYIVKNSLGKYLEEKEKEVFDKHGLKEHLQDQNYTKRELEAYQEYKEVLSNVKVLDPACGSGAFLVKVFDYLFSEHKRVADILTNIRDKQVSIFDTDVYFREILQNNIYGVDLNPESVEITKLSLWLKTAQKGKKLAVLDNNIKCGNSLIDDKEIAGERAFVWEKEFPQIFSDSSEQGSKFSEQGSKFSEQGSNLSEQGSMLPCSKECGGFDVIVGNPPYVRQELLGTKNKEFYLKKYINAGNSIADLYVYFFELAISLLKEKGRMAYISPNKWMERKYGENMRAYLKYFDIEQIVNFGELRIFEDASTESAITVIKKERSKNPIQYSSITSLEEAKNPQNYRFGKYKKENLRDDIWRFLNPHAQEILNKFKNDTISLNEYTQGGVFYGIKTGFNKAFIITEEEAKNIIVSDANSKEILKSMVEGDDFEKWNLLNPQRYMIATGYDIDVPNKYPGVYKFLLQFEEQLIKRQDKGKNWYNLRACDYYEKLDQPKIVYYHTALKHSFYFDTEGYYISANCYFISNADRYLQCILNSALFNYVKKYLFPAFGNAEKGGRIRLDANKMINLPIKNIKDEEKVKFENAAINVSKVSKEFHDKKQKFLKLIQSRFQLETISKKLEKFYELDFSEFMKQMNKGANFLNKGACSLVQKKKISMEEEMELMNLFNKKAEELQSIKKEIDKQDKIIDEMVFDLYGLDEYERKVVLEG